jgi:hypothetical protein
MIILFDFILVKNGHFIATATNRERQREKLLGSRRKRKTKIKRRIQNLFPQTFKIIKINIGYKRTTKRNR